MQYYFQFYYLHPINAFNYCKKFTYGGNDIIPRASNGEYSKRSNSLYNGFHSTVRSDGVRSSFRFIRLVSIQPVLFTSHGSKSGMLRTDINRFIKLIWSSLENLNPWIFKYLKMRWWHDNTLFENNFTYKTSAYDNKMDLLAKPWCPDDKSRSHFP